MLFIIVTTAILIIKIVKIEVAIDLLVGPIFNFEKKVLKTSHKRHKITDF